MGERFQRLYTLQKELFSEECPVLIEAGALLKDTNSGAVLAQLKMMNIGEKPIKSCKVSLRTYEDNGRETQGVEEFAYLDLNAKTGDEFGSRTPVFLPDRITRSFSVDVREIVFSDGTVYEFGSNTWKQVPARRPVKEVLQNEELAAQYRLEAGRNADFFPEKKDGLFLCTCGAVNRETADSCCRCHRSYEEQTRYADTDYLNQRLEERKKQEAAAQYEKQKAKKKRIRRIIIAALIVAVIGIAAFSIKTVREKQKLAESSIDYIEPQRTVKSFTVGDAVINFSQDWYYEEITKDQLFTIYFSNEKPDKVDDAVMFVTYVPGIVKGQVTREQAKQSYEIVASSYLSGYPNSESLLEEHITRNGIPAYHANLHQKGTTYDIYFFMANKTDMIIVSEAILDDAENDHHDDFMSFIRGVKTEIGPDDFED